MRKVKNPNLAQLLLQLRFTPAAKRRKQLDSAEKLLRIIDRKKKYPFDFIFFHITGFYPKEVLDKQLVNGDELIDDIGVFISKLSGQLARPATEQGQRVYTIEEAAETLAVSTKTINRWRKNGLVARKFIFDDGKKRLGFLQSAIDKFIKANPELVSKAGTFSRLTNKQKQQIIKQAAKLGSKTTMSRHQIISLVAAQTGKAHETIRYIILNYEKAGPDKSIFSRLSGVMNPAENAELYKLFRKGCSVAELMERFGRSKSSVYRIINRRRARELLAEKIEFIASDEFLEKDAEEKILARPIETQETVRPGDAELTGLSGDSLMQYFQILKDVPLLNREREFEFFRRYNYLKYLVCITRAGMKPVKVSSSRLRKIENSMAEAETIKKIIIESNLRLVVSIARKHTAGGANFSDLVSEGNLSLMRAVEKFDYTRGVRFATYASWAIAKDYAHRIPARAGRQDKSGMASLKYVQRDLRIASSADFTEVERARQSLVQVIKDELNEREQYIILNHFALTGSLIRKNKKTLRQIGEHLGLSKERVRQIELVALQKLRHSLSMEEFDLLMG